MLAGVTSHARARKMGLTIGTKRDRERSARAYPLIGRRAFGVDVHNRG
jgi:hypothetical protein